MSVLPASMCVQHVDAQCPQKLRRSTDTLDVMNGCELPCRCLGTKPRSPAKAKRPLNHRAKSPALVIFVIRWEFHTFTQCIFIITIHYYFPPTPLVPHSPSASQLHVLLVLPLWAYTRTHVCPVSMISPNIFSSLDSYIANMYTYFSMFKLILHS